MVVYICKYKVIYLALVGSKFVIHSPRSTSCAYLQNVDRSTSYVLITNPDQQHVACGSVLRRARFELAAVIAAMVSMTCNDSCHCLITFLQ